MNLGFEIMAKAHRDQCRETVRLRYALQNIIDRSNNGELGTSKVIDMRRIAEQALEAGE